MECGIDAVQHSATEYCVEAQFSVRRSKEGVSVYIILF